MERIDRSTLSPELTSLLERLKDGSSFYKIISKNKCLRRKYRVDVDNLRLFYTPTKKMACQGLPHVDLTNALCVRKGWTTDKFKFCERRARRHYYMGDKANPNEEVWSEDRCFSIIFPAISKTIDLVAENKETRDYWVDALRHVLDSLIEPPESSLDYDSFIRKQFVNADTNKNGSLSIDEIQALFRSFNLYLDTPTLKQHYSEMKPGFLKSESDIRMTMEDFEQMFHRLNHRKELRQIYDFYLKKEQLCWDLEDLMNFCTEQEQDPVTTEYCSEIIKKHEPTTDTETAQLSWKGFLSFMMSPEQMIFDWKHNEVCEDMNQPLSHYYIASSHNTYLISNQLTGISSINAYKRVLEEGCRCIELDVWDGSYFEISDDPELNEEPIIYHGHTLTTKILLRDVLEVIRNYAFVSSKYPVILSIENHCSLQQQQVMADYFFFILGDLLLTEPLPDHEEDWPSPEELANKIIIKGKKMKKPKQPVTPVEEKSGDDQETETDDALSPTSTDVPTISSGLKGAAASHEPLTRLLTTEYEDEADDEQHQSLLAKLRDLNMVKTKGKEIPNPLDYTDKTNLVIDDQVIPGEEEISIIGPNVDLVKRFVSDFLSLKKKEKQELLEALADLTVYCCARRFKTFEDAIHWKFFEMSSFSETKAASLITSDIHSFQEFNLRHMSRIYPKGTRADSSNYKPNLYWSAGCQMVALNYQSPDKAMRTNRAMFRSNARCGYILKPSHLRSKTGIEEMKRRESTSDQSAKKTGGSSKKSKASLKSSSVKSKKENEDQTRMKDEDTSSKEEEPGLEASLEEEKEDYEEEEERVKITVISGQTMQRPKSGHQGDDVVDPYVEVKLFGEPNEKQKFKTKYIKNNGFNPVWNETFEFDVKQPRLAFLQFVVKDQNTTARDKKLGQYLLPVSCMKRGYRHLRLQADDEDTNSTLFVHVARDKKKQKKYHVTPL